MLLGIGLLSCLVWLDSLDRYLDARYHLSLDSWMPEPLYTPSRLLGQWVQPELGALPAVASRPSPANAPPGPPVHSAAQAASRAADVAQLAADEALRRAPSAVVAASGASDGKALRYSVQPLAPGKFWPSQRNQSLRAGPQYIFFAGDSMMQGVAPLLIRELSQQHPDWQMLDESRQSTGLTVKRYFDWPARIIERIDELPLTLLVVFLGPNDPWDIYEPGRHIVFPSPQWQERYTSRVQEILRHAVAHDVRVLWIGLPSMREGRVRDGAVLQNQIFAQQALAHGTDYLATEGLIGPLSEPFQRYLGDDTTQSLRSGDGIHFSPAGLHRVKQAVLEHLLGPGAPAALKLTKASPP